MPSASQPIRRERKIMDIVYELTEAFTKVMEAHLINPPSYSAIRATMNRLEIKGFIVRRERDLKHVYYPLVDRQQVRGASPIATSQNIL